VRYYTAQKQLCSVSGVAQLLARYPSDAVPLTMKNDNLIRIKDVFVREDGMPRPLLHHNKNPLFVTSMVSRCLVDVCLLPLFRLQHDT
jgi:hypothetical protein